MNRFWPLVVVPFLVASQQVASIHQSATNRPDWFQGSWILLECTTIDDKGKLKQEVQPGIIVTFCREGIQIQDPRGKDLMVHPYKLLNPRSQAEGEWDIFEKAGGKPIPARYRFTHDRFFLCVGDDEGPRPKACEPEKNIMFYEFVPYQPRSIVQSHNLPESPKVKQ